MIRETAYDEVFDAQLHFRLIMDSMARPGKINVLNGVAIHPPAGLNRASAHIGLALLNADVSYFVSRNPAEIASYFVVNTASAATDAAAADFLFLTGTDDVQWLEEAKIGTLTYPDTSAFVVLDVATLSDEPLPGLRLTLRGPGVKGEKEVYASGLTSALLDTLRTKNAEYPLGIDVILTDTGDRILCLPRTTKISW